MSDRAPFFPKNNSVQIQIFYDEEKQAFVAEATHAQTSEVMFSGHAFFDPEHDEGNGKDQLHDAIGSVMDRVEMLWDSPEIFNDRLKALTEENKPSKKGSGKTVVRLIR